MQRTAVVAKLKPDAADKARKLIENGPPFDPTELGFERHHVYISEGTAVFVFEGANVNALIKRLGEAGGAQQALAAWEPLLQGIPELAHEAYFWERAVPAGSAAWGE